MKKHFLFLVLFPFFLFAQDDNKKATGEIKTNVFDLVVAKTLNIGYEHFLNGNQALQVEASFFDHYSYLDISEIEKNNLFSLQASYNIYFSKSKKHHGFVFYPFAKFRTGTQEILEFVSSSFDPSTGFYAVNERTISNDLSGFELGFGLGHKWLFNDKISLGIGSQLGRNLSSDTEFDRYYPGLNFRANVTLGVRF
jgi:hypothetical protein